MNSQRKSFLFLLLLAATFLRTPTGTAQTNLTEAVDFTVTDIHGQEYQLFDILAQGHHVILDFFDTECGPCIAAIPSLNAAYEQYGCNQGEVFFLSINYAQSDYTVYDYQTTYGLLNPAVSGLNGGGNQVLLDYGIAAFPTVILIAPDHQILNQDIFPVNLENLELAIGQQAGIPPQPGLCQVTSVREAGPSSLRLFPNPVTGDYLYLEVAASRGTANLEIYTSDGKALLLRQRFNLNVGTPLEIPISNLSPGLYWLRLNAGGQVITRMFSRQ